MKSQNLKINISLLFSGFFSVFTGFLIQIKYQIGNHGGINDNIKIMSFSRSDWSLFHKISILIFLGLMVYHIILHLKWYKIVFKKHLLNKHKQIIILSSLFLLATITGLIPWFIHLSGSKRALRLIFIEIHDKISILLTIFLILHVAKRLKWFSRAFVKQAP